ncbi:MAG TPA: electron transfer flavoprotein subunit beta/FixA family protein [Candidatus Saccharimonadales bacterium]|nr:electron transfer flavoprotein subunit beta/FixA family protein [Candidatus Saccharimonadales bacterium]
MKILTCLKQVPDSTTKIKVAADARSVVTEGITWSISPYDEYAVELALEHKDGDPATTVSAVSVGPARAKDALRAALAMGCDDATLVTGDGVENATAAEIAAALAAVVTDLAPELVVCGKQASDDDQGLVGPALADLLGWPHVALVTKFAAAGGGLEIWKEVEGGHEVWKATGPVVLTVQKSAKEPRYPSLPGIMKAKKKEIPERAFAATDGPRTLVTRLEPPPQRGAGKILKDGDPAGLATELVALLRDEAKVL